MSRHPSVQEKRSRGQSADRAQQSLKDIQSRGRVLRQPPMNTPRNCQKFMIYDKKIDKKDFAWYWKYIILTMFSRKSLWVLIQQPFAFLHLRWIQYRYKKLSTSWRYQQSNKNLAKLKLLQAWEDYYKSQFESWGKYHPEFSYNDVSLKIHEERYAKLFPDKDFEELDIVTWYSHESVNKGRNDLFDANQKIRELKHALSKLQSKKK